MTLYGRKEAARLAGLHEITLHYWEKEGKAPSPTRVGRVCVYSDQDVENLRSIVLNNSKNKITSGAQFGDWTVLKRTNVTTCGGIHRKWKCQCICGRVYYVWNTNLSSGRSRRCRQCQRRWSSLQSNGKFQPMFPREVGLPYQRHDATSKIGKALREKKRT